MAARRPRFRQLPVLLLILAALGVVGCGGSEATGDSSTAAAPGGSAGFEVEGGDNSVQEFGREAGTAERKAAAEVLRSFLDASAAGDWSVACSYLSVAARESLDPIGGCPRALERLASGASTGSLREPAVAAAGGLRLRGDRGFLLYRAPPAGTVYAIPVVGEGGGWKLGSTTGVPLG